jgi:hypothetical protein
MFGTSANITLSDGTNLAHISRKVITVADMAADKQTVSTYRLLYIPWYHDRDPNIEMPRRCNDVLLDPS